MFRHMKPPTNIPNLAYIKASIKGITLKLEAEPISIWTLANKYAGGKRLMYLRAAADVQREGWRRSWANVSMFVKPDKYPVDELMSKAPRAIQYRQPAYNLIVGRYLHPYEKALYDLPDVGPSKTPFMAKGKNAQERATLLLTKTACFNKPVFIGIDHSKFDSTVSVDHLKIEHSFYNKHFKSRFLRRVLRLQLYNKGYSKNGIKYRVRGTRMSGDYNTGLGNSLLNYLCLRSWLNQAGVVGEVFLDGDDAIVIVEGEDYSKLDHDHFKLWGFDTKIQICHDIRHVEFCQSKVLPSVPTMARNPFRALSHLAVGLKNYSPAMWPRVMNARGMCEVMGSAGVPILAAYGAALVNRTIPFHEEQEKWELAKRSKIVPVTDEARLDFYESWGIDPHHQELIEASFSDPCSLSVSKLSIISDKYDAQSLRSAWEAWSALGGNSGESWSASR